MRGWTRVEKALLLLGLAGIDFWLLSKAESAIYQAWQGWVFERQVHGQPAKPSDFLAEKRDQIGHWFAPGSAPAPPPRPNQPIRPPVAADGVVGRLSIPRLQLSAVVREGVGEDTLRVALGHIPTTAFPGQPGNVAVAGHRDTLFRELRNIRSDDVILFETLGGNYAYRVQSTQVVNPDDVAVLKPGPSPELTLVTCYPFSYVGSAPQRFIVKATLVGRAILPNAT